jgi:hypothetical protein
MKVGDLVKVQANGFLGYGFIQNLFEKSKYCTVYYLGYRGKYLGNEPKGIWRRDCVTLLKDVDHESR